MTRRASIGELARNPVGRDHRFESFRVGLRRKGLKEGGRGRDALCVTVPGVRRCVAGRGRLPPRAGVLPAGPGQWRRPRRSSVCRGCAGCGKAISCPMWRHDWTGPVSGSPALVGRPRHWQAQTGRTEAMAASSGGLRCTDFHHSRSKFQERCLSRVGNDWRKAGSDRASADQVVREIRRATRNHYGAEERPRKVLEGLRGRRKHRRAVPARGPWREPLLQLIEEIPRRWQKRIARDMAHASTTDEFRRIRRRPVPELPGNP